MYQPTDLNWHWLGVGGDDGSGPAAPCAMSASTVHPEGQDGHVLTGSGRNGNGHSSHEHVNGNGLNDASFYDAYQYPYNYGAPTEAQYVGTVFHGDPIENVSRINAVAVPVSNGEQVLPAGPADPDSTSLLDLSNLSTSTSSSIMDLSNHISTALQRMEEDEDDNNGHMEGPYDIYASAGHGFSQADAELRILKTENMYSNAGGFIPTAIAMPKSSNGCVFARKSKPSTSSNGFSMEADIDLDQYDEDEDDDSDSTLTGQHLQDRRRKRINANNRSTQIQNERNAQHPNALRCEICGNLFRGKLVLRRHQIVIHHLRLPNWEQVLAAEERNNTKVPCGVCGKHVAKRSLNIHMTQVHQGGRIGAVRHFKKGRKLGRPRKAPPVLQPQAAPHKQSTSADTDDDGVVDYSYLLLPKYQPFVPVERFTSIAKAVARYEQHVAARITKKRRSSSFDSAAWKKSLPNAICNLCGNVFRHIYTLRVHQAKVHKIPVPRLYCKRTPTPSPVKISGQAHAPPPPPSVVRALYRSTSLPSLCANNLKPPKLEMNMGPPPLPASMSPSMPCLTPVTATVSKPTNKTTPDDRPHQRPGPASRRLALAPEGARSVVAGDKAHANKALIRNSKFLDYLQSPNLQPRLRRASAPDLRWCEDPAQLQESDSSSSKRKRSWPRERPRLFHFPRHQTKSKGKRRRRRRRKLGARPRPPQRRPGRRLANTAGVNAKIQPTASSTYSRNNSFHNPIPTPQLLKEIQHRQLVIRIRPVSASAQSAATTIRTVRTSTSEQRSCNVSSLHEHAHSPGIPDSKPHCHICLKVFKHPYLARDHLVLVHQVHAHGYDEVPRQHRCKVHCKQCGFICSLNYMYIHLRKKHNIRADYGHHFTRVAPKLKLTKPKPEQEQDNRESLNKNKNRKGATLPPHAEATTSSVPKLSPEQGRQALANHGPWICSLCQQRVSSQRNLIAHQTLRHDLEPPGFTHAMKATLEKPRQKVQCKICGHRTTRANYSTHFRLKHEQDGLHSKPWTARTHHFTVLSKETNGLLPQPATSTSKGNTESDSAPADELSCCKICCRTCLRSGMDLHLQMKHRRSSPFGDYVSTAAQAPIEPEPEPTEELTTPESELEEEQGNDNADSAGSPAPEPSAAASPEPSCAQSGPLVADFRCHICQKEFATWNTLRKHQVVLHKLKLAGHDKILRKRSLAARCNICRSILPRRAIHWHLKGMHGVRTEFPNHYRLLPPKPQETEASDQVEASPSASAYAVDSQITVMSVPLPLPSVENVPESSAPSSNIDLVRGSAGTASRNRTLNHLRKRHGKTGGFYGPRTQVQRSGSVPGFRQWQCDSCTKTFTLELRLRQHQMMVHHLRGEGHESILRWCRLARCTLCNQTMKLNSVTSHLKRKHGKKKAFHKFYVRIESSAQKDVQKRDHGKSESPTAAASESNPAGLSLANLDSQALLEHGNQSKGEAQEPEPTYSAAAAALCLLCNKILSKGRISTHLNKIHGKSSGVRKFYKYTLKSVPVRVRLTLTDLQCAVCSKVFTNRCTLEHHKVSMHNLQFPGHEQVRAYPQCTMHKVRCNVCNAILRKSTIHKHLQRHGFKRATRNLFTALEAEKESEASADPNKQPHLESQTEASPQLSPHASASTSSIESPQNESQQTVCCNICHEIMARASIGKHLITLHDQRVSFWRFFTVLQASESEDKKPEQKVQPQSQLKRSKLLLRHQQHTRRSCRLNLDGNKNAIKPTQELACTDETDERPERPESEEPSAVRSNKKPGRRRLVQQLKEQMEKERELRRMYLEIMTRRSIVQLQRLRQTPQDQAKRAEPPTGEEAQPPRTSATENVPEAESSPAPSSVAPPTVTSETKVPPTVTSVTPPTATPETGDSSPVDTEPVLEPVQLRRKRRRLEVRVEDVGLLFTTCPICKKRIPYAILDTHKEKHTVECHICQMNVRLADVAAHGMTHVIRLDCEECGRVFKQPALLWEHMNRHFGVEPLFCTWCGAGFATQASLRTHILINHTNTAPFGCALCERRFTTRAAKRMHEARH